MKKEQDNVQERKPQKTKIKMTFAILFLAILFILELYLMMNYSKEYLFLGIAGLGILCLVYIVTDLNFKIRQERDVVYEKEYENLYKAQKVSYVFMKQSLTDMGELLERIKENTEVPADELIEAQKAVGKITIQRNRENAASVMNSNEKLMNHIVSLEDTMKDAIQKIEESTDNQSPEMIDRQQEIIENIENLEKNQTVLKEEINKLAEQIGSQSNEILDEVKKSVSENAALLEEHIVSEISVRTVESSVPMETVSGDPEEIAITEENMTAEEPAAVEESVTEELIEPEEKVTMEEPAAMEESVTEELIEPEENMMAKEPAAVEESIIEELTEPEEKVTMEEPAAVEEVRSEESVTEEEPAETVESVLKEEIKEQENTETLEELAASGKTMTPEEIASLLEESAAAEKPQEPVQEEKAAMPDLSDPGHVMTPEEIAALLANL